MTSEARAPSRKSAVRLLGTGVHEPSRVVTSEELDDRYDRPPGTTFDRSGVTSRRWAGADETSSLMAAAAVDGALQAAGLGVADLDALIVTSVLPEQPMPTNAVLTLAELEAPGGRCEAFDINASCVGFLTAMQVAVSGIDSGRWQRVAIASTEIASKGLDHGDIESSALFGDGAAAVILGASGPGESSAVLATKSGVWPASARTCRIDAGGTRWNTVTPPPDPRAYLFHMEGVALLRSVARYLPSFLHDVEAASGIRLADLDVMIPHQASAVGLRYLRERVGVRPESVVDILADHGNQVSASIPTALHHAVATGRLRRGDSALLAGTGAGLSLSAVMVRF